MCPLEVYTWLDFKGILQYVPSPSSPSLRPKGAQLPYCTNQPFLEQEYVTELGSSGTLP